MRDELYCTPSSRIVNIDYETPLDNKVECPDRDSPYIKCILFQGVFSSVCDEQFVTPHEELPPKRSARPRKK